MKFRFIFLYPIITLVGCNEIKTETNQVKPEEIIETAVVVKKIIEPLKEAEDFDFPIGKPDAKGYYNAQPFRKNNHLGDDWNGVGGGNTDLGDNVFAIGNVKVMFAEDIKGGWGNVVRIIHQRKGKMYESLYAHLDTILVKKDQILLKGSKIGTIGNAHGMYLAHLHLEVRESINMDIGNGYSKDKQGYINPTNFIKSN